MLWFDYVNGRSNLLLAVQPIATFRLKRKKSAAAQE